MAIDRIGKGAGLPPTPETSGAGGASPAGATFKVDRPEAATSAERSEKVGQAGAPTPLDRFRAGEVDVHGYIDLEVDHATSSLKGLPAAELEELKSVLRDQMRSDPGLADLVRTATGKMPSPPDDG